MDNFVIISGCSGGGKSTLLAELSARGFSAVEEPGRRVVQQQMAANGHALPWIDLRTFLLEAFALAKSDYEAAGSRSGTIFFDRGLIDAASALRQLGEDSYYEMMRKSFRYQKRVFLTPPWPEIYITDAERRHGLDDATEEYERLVRDYDELGYAIVLLPKISVEERVQLILRELELC
ncbi:AAA family ATPase [Agrobacterium larrymoorei]|uniref:AAA family ATPase n=1 Tax=Agrobacterium larrymoorei TaxID=160699 RepID=UPI00157328E1|nr:AAA family ATPase [Agrobacterium larrymoorei]NTJ43116.1 AAA family ATPase [Agrobacterium larrymoorei]